MYIYLTLFIFSFPTRHLAYLNHFLIPTI